MTAPLKPTWRGKYSVRFNNGTCWPRLGVDEDEYSLSHVIRYGLDIEVVNHRYDAASYIEAYKKLISMPRTEREQIIRALRAAEKDPK